MHEFTYMLLYALIQRGQMSKIFFQLRVAICTLVPMTDLIIPAHNDQCLTSNFSRDNLSILDLFFLIACS